MNTKLHVDNVAVAAAYSDLMDLFSVYGNVVDVNLPLDRATGRRRGYAIVTMASPEGARAALTALQGKEVASHALRISEAQPNKFQTTAVSRGLAARSAPSIKPAQCDA